MQSWVASGHVGNASAVFPLQRLGAEVCAIHTVQFSNHPGHGGFTGQVFNGAAIGGLVDGLAARGVLGRCDAVLSGYVGGADVGGAVLDAVSRTRAARPGAWYCCDPVIGDEPEGVYVKAGVADLVAGRAVPLADILTPNLFELRHLTGHACLSLRGVADAAQWLRGRMRRDGPGAVVVTSVRAEDTPEDAIDMLALDTGGAWRVRTPRLLRRFNGAGDLLAALFLFHRWRTDTPNALSMAASSVHGVLRQTDAAGADELCIVAAQTELVAPTTRFHAASI